MPSPGSHKSGFYVVMNRGRQWIYFRLRRNWPGLGLPPAIRSLNMVGPGVPGQHGGLIKAEACPVWGRRFHPPQGLLLAGPSPTTGGSAVGRSGCQQAQRVVTAPSPHLLGHRAGPGPCLVCPPHQLLPEWETPPPPGPPPPLWPASVGHPTPASPPRRRLRSVSFL